ncbi:MAG: F0F1 ATP synthase subunit delta [Betaproteobacteria bacterium]|nr:F0F1 ATP synthase subunit delta [Betaproteobacteria bacterium]
MAELATIARPYAEALLKAGGDAAAASELTALAAVASNQQLLAFADDPKGTLAQVTEVMTSVISKQLKAPLSPKVGNLLAAVLENGRLAALGEIAQQFQLLINARSGVADAVIHSAFELSAAQTDDVKATLEKRFGRKLNATVVIDASLIGGIRVVVGDEVLDTSVKARLEQMKLALTA